MMICLADVVDVDDDVAAAIYGRGVALRSRQRSTR